MASDCSTRPTDGRPSQKGRRGLEDGGFRPGRTPVRAHRPAIEGLAALGPDRNAIRDLGREEGLYDLGRGSGAAAFCIRTPDPVLARELDARAGQGWAKLLGEIGGRIVEASMTRVVTSPVGRAEVFTPISLPGGRSPDGSHTHLLPSHLAVGRETPPGLDLPEALAPCAIFYPRVRLAEADAYSGTSRPAPA